MQKMIGPQQIAVARRCDGLGQYPGAPVNVLGTVLTPDPQRIQHRGDAACRQLPVIGNYRSKRVPEYLGPRDVMRLEVIGVQFDQAGA